MPFSVVIGPGAFNDLDDIHQWIALRAGPDVADEYQELIIRRCEAMGDAPLTGTPHDELLAGLRTAPFERRATICYLFNGEVVSIVRVLHAGRDARRAFR